MTSTVIKVRYTEELHFAQSSVRLQRTHRHGMLGKGRQIFNCRLFNPDEVTVVIRLAENAEVNEMWSLVGKKHELRWLWRVIDHRSGHILAHVFGRRKDLGFLKRQVLLEPFGIAHYYILALGVHTHVISMPIERKHLT